MDDLRDHVNGGSIATTANGSTAGPGRSVSRRTALRWLASGTAAGIAAGFPRIARSQATPVRFLLTGRTQHFSDVYVSMNKGLFAQEGLAVEIVTVPNTEPGVVLLSGRADIGGAYPGGIYLANAQGADLVCVYSPANIYITWIAQAPISSPQQLSNARIGVWLLTDLDAIYTHRVMRKFGFKPDQYTLVQAGTTPDKMAAIRAGKITAAAAYPPGSFLATKEGFTQIYDSIELNEQDPSTYTVSATWARKNPDTLVKFCRALNRAHDWLFDLKNKAEAISIVSEWTKQTPEVATQSYRLIIETPGVYSKKGEWSRAAFERTGSDLRRLKMLDRDPVPYEKVVLPEFREKAAQSS
jgi:NitT/TauT family transport system substrate-binding protein